MQTPVSSPHWHDKSSVTGVMLNVVYALIPGLLCYIWFFGWGILFQCLLAAACALLFEYMVLRLRGREAGMFLRDGSVAVTGLLLALAISPLTPWWITVIGTAFAVIIAKHVFGGIGHNLFNPAMAGYVFILLCFPAQMNTWMLPLAQSSMDFSAIDSLAAIFVADQQLIDAVSGATPLNDMKSRLDLMGMVSEIRGGALYGNFAGKGWEWIAIAWLLGGIYLLLRGIINWHIPVSVITGTFVISLLFNIYDPDTYASPLFHILSGGTLFCAFFIATDPVTAAASNRGRLIYGCLIGLLIYIIRVWGAYPDGVGFAVLIANALVPLIDLKTRPRVFGEQT